MNLISSKPMPSAASRRLLLLAGVLLAAGVQAQTRASTDMLPELRTAPGDPPGYLSAETLPHSLALMPPPPASGSAGMMLDEENSQKSFALRGTPRWAQAAEDAHLDFPRAAGTFSCTLGAPVNPRDTPHLYLLLRRLRTDAAVATAAAKDHYKRARPFMVNHAPQCTPEEEERLRNGGSYPSAHSAIGMAWGLALTEIAPERTDAILARSLAYGQSRVVCNVHWQSDINQARFMGAATIARLHAVAEFRADLEAAKGELAAARARGLKPERDCAAEAAALAPPR